MKHFLLLLGLFITTTVMAGPVNQETAKKKATDFIAVKMAAKSKQQVKAVNSNVMRQRVSNGAKRAKASRDYLHVFNIDGGGYVVVSGDDRTEDILGYSLTGTFDPENLPENMRAFLQEYADGIQYLDDNNIKVSKGGAPMRAKTSISKLVQTTWDQWAPYNIYCPQITSSERGLTGCAATALAQVLYYHKWPASTKKEIPGYTTSSRGKKIDAIPAGTAIDWNSMVLKYTIYYDTDKTKNNATASEKAVGSLMLMCGASLRMDYNISSYGGSSAYSQDWPQALINYFDYEEETVKYVSRKNYSYSDWQDLIYNELANQRPVLYSGQSAGGGHAFICDGYDKDDFFHINWGWSGGSDNFFRLRLLNPSDQGAGGSTTNDGYGLGQDAIIGIQKNDGTTVTKPIALNLYALDFKQTGIARSSTSADFSPSDAITYYLINSNGATYSFEIGVRIVNSSGTTMLEQSMFTQNDLPNGYYTYSSWLPSFGNGWANGTYKLYFLSRQKGATDWVIAGSMEDNPIVFTISGTTLTFKEQGMASVNDLTISGTVKGSMKANEAQTVTITVKNNNTSLPYRTDIYYKMSGSSAVVAGGFLEVEAGQTTVLTFAVTPSSNGTYSIQLYSDWQGKNAFGDAISFTIGEASGDPKEDLKVTEIGVYNSSATNHVISGNVFRATGFLKNEGKVSYTGIFAPTLYVYNWDLEKFEELTDKQYNFTLNSGKTASFDVSFDNPNVGSDDYYMMVFWVKIDGEWINLAHTDYFEFVESTGINSIKVDQPAAKDGKVFNLNGQQMPNDVKSLKPGLYIVNGKKVVIK